MVARTISPFFRIAEPAYGTPYIRVEPFGEGDNLEMFKGSTGAFTLHLKPGTTIGQAAEVAKYLRANIGRITEQD